MAKHVLITGGAGFIGSHVAKALVDAGETVTVFDSLISGKRERVPEQATFIQGDIRDTDALAKAFAGVTHVVHLAALVSVPKSVEDPEGTHEVNVVGTANVLEAARKAGAKRFVYATSAAVYGDEPSLPKHETSPLRPQSPYASSKAENEQQAQRYASEYGLSTIGLRFFNVYGVGQAGDHPYASVIPRWIEAAKNSAPMLLFGEGTQTRDFVAVEDVARAVVLALDSNEGGVFNVASGKEVPIKEVRAMIAARFPNATLENDEARAGDIMRSVADISKAKEKLGFEPKVTLEEGIATLVDA